MDEVTGADSLPPTRSNLLLLSPMLFKSPYVNIYIVIFYLQKIDIRSSIYMPSKYVERGCSKHCLTSVTSIGGSSVYCCEEDKCNAATHALPSFSLTALIIITLRMMM